MQGLSNRIEPVARQKNLHGLRDVPSRAVRDDRAPVKQVAGRQCPSAIEQFLCEDFIHRLKCERHLDIGRMLIGQAKQRHAHDEVDFPGRESKFQRCGGLFISRHDGLKAIVQPGSEIPDPLWITDKQVNVIADPVFEGQHEPRSTTQLGVHLGPSALLRIGHHLGSSTGEFAPRAAGLELRHVVARGHVRSATSCSHALTRGMPSARVSA
nr:hypothetical protein [Thiomonas arsenitoxydans]